MLLFRNAPYQNVQLTDVVRKVSSNLLADEGPRQVRNFKAAIDRVVIGNGNVIHLPLAQLLIQLLWIGIAVGKIESAEKPFLRPRTMARMDMEIAPAHLTFLASTFVQRSNPDTS